MRQWKLGGSGIVVTPRTAAREAARLGGQAVVRAIGNEGMRELAKRGGAATAAKGKEHLAELGRRGQRARAANLRRAVLREVEAQADALGRDMPSLLEWLRSEIAACEKK